MNEIFSIYCFGLFYLLNLQCKCNDKIMTHRSGKMVFTKTSKYQEER